MRSEPLAVSQAGWCRNDLDRFVLAHLDGAGLKPQPEAAPEVLARRLSLALTGLPISVPPADRFVVAHARDADAAVAALADDLLASPAYGEHFAWWWMDSGRYADSNGYQLDGNRSMWRWRDWLIAALNRNQPFDQMTREMLAGDLLIPASLRGWQSGDLIRDAEAGERVLATGFLRNHSYDTGLGTIAAESKFENAADRMETVGTVWMGLTLHCARCHDHKFDPLPARDYYSMLAFFDKVPEFGMSLLGASHPYLRTPDRAGLAKVAALDAKMNAASGALEQAEPRIAKAQEEWEHRTSKPAPGPAVDRPAFDAQRVTRGLRFHFAPEPLVFDGNTQQTESPDAVKLCEGGRAFAISFWFRQEGAGDAAILSSVNVPEGTWRGFTMDVVGGRLRLRLVYRWVHSHIEFLSREPFRAGEWHQVTVVANGLMQGIGYRAFLDGDTSPRHPLTARVSVNRLWQQLWGRGFVDSPENFGTQCAQPEQAALLDWLATEYVRLGWDTKALLKLIVTSATFRQSSAAPAELWLSDPANRLLARGPRFRLPIHVVRDQALSVSGLLKPDIGGPPVLLEHVIDRKGEEEDEGKSDFVIETHRRTLYTYWKRNAPHPVLAVFDVADRNQCEVRVRRTNTPLQALVTLNEPGLAECARAFARRIREHEGGDAARLTFAFHSATGRAPVSEELRRLDEALQTYRAHFKSEPEAAAQLAGPDGDAAWTAMANVLLNLDATLTLE